MSLVGEAAVMADLGEGLGGANDEVTGFLDTEMAQVFLGGHVEARFEFSQKTAEGKVGCFCEFGDGDVVPVMLVEKLERGAEFFVFAERGGALVEGAADADDSANLAVGISKRFFCRGGPIDKSTAAWDEFDAIGD